MLVYLLIADQALVFAGSAERASDSFLITHRTVAHLLFKVAVHLRRVNSARMTQGAQALALGAVALLAPVCQATWPTVVAYGSSDLAEWTSADGGPCHAGADGRTLDEQDTDDTAFRRLRGCHVVCWC